MREITFPVFEKKGNRIVNVIMQHCPLDNIEFNFKLNSIMLHQLNSAGTQEKKDALLQKFANEFLESIDRFYNKTNDVVNREISPIQI